jgi:hypothetical protein
VGIPFALDPPTTLSELIWIREWTEAPSVPVLLRFRLETKFERNFNRIPFMIECIFTLDYEIFGNGTGALKDLVYEPAEQLRDIFKSWNERFVAFVEVVEFEKIEACGSDSGIDLVKRQIRELYAEGFEVGLHLHPQWSNAEYVNGQWVLDASEYNLCTLTRNRIVQIVERALDYMRYVVDEPAFTPLSFRAGNWLFQPTETAASVLAERGIKVDSSVFKGGVQRNHGLDYRRARRNGYYWSFSSDVNKPDPSGTWIEVPIYTQLVPFWRMATSKRMSFGNIAARTAQPVRQRINRTLDLARFRYPMKLDFCRMTPSELTGMMDKVIKEDRADPDSYRPVVAIGHTKDLTDLQTVWSFLAYLQTNGLRVSTFESAYPSMRNEVKRTAEYALGE